MGLSRNKIYVEFLTRHDIDDTRYFKHLHHVIESQDSSNYYLGENKTKRLPKSLEDEVYIVKTYDQT